MSYHSWFARVARPSLFFAWFLTSIAGLAAGCGGDRVVHFRVLFSGDLRSYIEPCACRGPSAPGGLARRAGYMDSVRSLGDELIVVDAGDWLVGSDELAAIRSRHLMSALGTLGMDAMAVGESDFHRGVRFPRDVADSAGVPLVAANLKQKPDGRDYTRPYVIRRIGARAVGPFHFGGYRVGIFGLIGQREMKIPGVPRDSIAASDPEESARQMVQELREKRDCRMVIALAHIGLDPARRLARNVPGIDLIVTGHSGAPLETPERYGDAFLVHGGEQGATIGEARYNLGVEGPPILESHAIVTLDSTVTENERGRAFLAGYKKDYQKFLEDPQEYPDDLKQMPQIFASAEQCASCHQEEAAAWRGTPHARAFATLEATGDDINPDCVGCHTTAYASANGFRHRKWTPQFENVQCEACHGPGSAHAEFQRARAEGRAHPVPPPLEEIQEPDCRRCHDGKNDPNFDFTLKLPLVRHAPSPAAAPGD